MRKNKTDPQPSGDTLSGGEKDLRQRAEARLRKQRTARGDISPEEARRLLYELEVHQIELELQNEELRRSQAELEASRTRYFDLYDLAPIGYLTISEKGLILEANLRAAILLGMDRSSLFRQPLSRYCAPDDSDMYYHASKKLFATGDPQEFELRMKNRDGAAFWVHAVATMVKDTSGASVCHIMLTDITRRKQAEERLRSTAQFSEENPSPVLRVSNDGILLYANQASDDLLDFWHCRVGEPVPKEIAVVLQDALHTGAPRELEVAIRGRLTLSFVVTPIAEQRYCNLYGRDITSIREAEASLHIVNARLDILAETARRLLEIEEPHLIVDILCRRLMSFLDCQIFFNFLVDKERQQLHLNAFAGIPRDEAAKIEWPDYGACLCGCVARDGCRIVAEDIVNTPDICTELVKSYGMQAYACHPLLSQGEVIGTLSFCTRTRPRFNDDDLSLMKAVADQVAIAMERKYAREYIAQLNSKLQSNVRELEAEVTRRTRAEKILLQYAEDLSRSNAELDSFAAAVSHDLQEPLRSIAGFMRLLEKKYGNLLDSRGTEYIERSVASSKRLGGMINSLLAYSRITTRGKGFEHHELDDVLKIAIDNLTASISRTKALITRGSLPRIYGDRDQLVRVFQNLIGNSIKYCERGRPEIYVSWQRSADTCIVAVTDNGPGIEPEYLEKIFEVFTRCSSNQRVSGTGMGLALCEKIIERHRGKIWAESVPGKGTTFLFSLPLH